MFTIEVMYKAKGMKHAAIRDRYTFDTMQALAGASFVVNVAGFTVARIVDNATGNIIGKITKKGVFLKGS